MHRNLQYYFSMFDLLFGPPAQLPEASSEARKPVLDEFIINGDNGGMYP